MDKQEFNKYCTKVLGFILIEKAAPYHEYRYRTDSGKYIFVKHYNPYDDANQRHEVFDKLNNSGFDKEAQNFQFEVFIKATGIDQAEREFIWSTKESSDVQT